MELYVPTPRQAMILVWASLKRESFSRKQTVVQKIILAFLCFVIYLAVSPIGLTTALFATAGVFILGRWLNLKVFAPGKNIVFTTAATYISILFCYTKIYAVLYRRVLRYISNAFPEYVPYNEHTLTKAVTSKEMSKRDKVWEAFLPKHIPKFLEKRIPNLLTLFRGGGGMWLFLHVNLPPEQFFSIAAILFLTDYFDGIWARVKKEITTFGEWADPIADRGLVAACVYRLYLLDPEFWNVTIVRIVVPELALFSCFGVLLCFKRKLQSPRPVVWGRIKFFVYFLGVLAFGLSWFETAVVLFSIGSVFAWIAVLSYVTREYQERKGESVFNGILRWCVNTSRIKKELFLKLHN